MALTKYRLGELLQLENERNSDRTYSLENVRGISIQKKFIETKANMDGVSLEPYILVAPDCFAYVTVTSRNGEKITIAHNTTQETYIVSSSYVVFSVSRTDILNSDYLFMYFNRPEFDRYARVNSWGSAREIFSWEDMCDIDIVLPDLSIQQKYVAIYDAILTNQKNYECGPKSLKLVCDSYIEDLRRRLPSISIGPYIKLTDNRNGDLAFNLDAVRGVSIDKKFIKTKADMGGVDLSPYFIVRPNEFAYVPVTSRNGEKISIAMNDSDDSYICSSSYVVFKSIDENTLYPPYLMMFFLRSEFNRYARFNSWGSAREIFSWNDLIDIKIPIPGIRIQRAISEIFEVYIQRKRICEQLKTQIKNICPILIKGSLEDGRAS